MFEAAQTFADSLQAAFARLARGQAEEQLKRPVSTLIEAAGQLQELDVQTTPEIVVSQGRPDIGVLSGGLLCGHIELKAPRETIDPLLMRGRNKQQWEKFQALPNLIYTNGREWRLFQLGQEMAILTLTGEPTEQGRAAVTQADGRRLGALLRAFLTWHPIVPHQPQSLARFLAPLARIIRDDVKAAVDNNTPSLIALREEWRAFLFPDFTDTEFADAYAQTLTAALLLARLEGADVSDPADAERALRAENSLLGRILRILTQEEVREDIRLGVSILQRVLNALEPDDVQREVSDPWLYFYEDFLRAYDPVLARNAGVYYTPAQVVQCQVRLVSDLLERRFGKRYSYADEGVTVLDPAVGTGTYLVAAIQRAMEIVDRRAGAQRPSRARELARNLIGFELLIGPYAVAHLRLSRELASAAGDEDDDPLADQPLRVFLADTLESPTPQNEGLLIPLMHKPLADERENARRVKADQQVIVCIGNPPYDRQMEEGAARKGGWVRFGDQSQAVPILEDFLEPARRAGQGVNLRSIYNDYVYFWRWALWKVFDTRQPGQVAPGIISFITGSSYLSGPGFVGMREEMRRSFDELWIIDLGGGSLGARREPNVFAIQTPVAIAVGVTAGAVSREVPAVVHYTRVSGSSAEKLDQVGRIRTFADLAWRDCPSDWHAPFKPALEGVYAQWPTIQQLFPWQHNGAQFVRTWPIGHTREVLAERWETFLRCSEPDRRTALKETRDRTIEWSSDRGNHPGIGEPALADLPVGTPSPTPVRYCYRSFDRQWALYDARVGDYIKPAIWNAHSDAQIYLTSLLSTPLGYGPSATFASHITDLDHFQGSFGGKSLIPLYRDPEGLRPNVTNGLASLLSESFGRTVEATEIFQYVAGLLGGRSFVSNFWDQLSDSDVRIPVTKSSELFEMAAELGRKFIAVETFGDHFAEMLEGLPEGTARLRVDIPHRAERYPNEYSYDEEEGILHVGDGQIEGVSAAVWSYEVSTLRVVDSWLGYRMRDRAGRKSSPLDNVRPETWTAGVTEELLDVLEAVERCVALEPSATEMLATILDSDLFHFEELPRPTPDETRPPRFGDDGEGQDQGILL
ncbi:type ISP restriction/modification enzyme [Brevundimonas sp.]|uniref:type ISP restriction/modification enzyme n=1 Tax=Brevundimonas sp. TaxID=1871086 RepID=UPI003566309C